MSRMSLWAVLGLTVLPAVTALGCKSGSEEPYKPEPAYSGRKASLPSIPSLPTDPIKNGDAYTIYGAVHQLNSRIHTAEITAAPITLVGYIVKTNYAEAPACAVHKTGKGDGENCVAPIPTFILSDKKDGSGAQIKVMGWASNFANIFDAIEKYKGKKEPPKEALKDAAWSVDIPYPLPNEGAKVKVTGKYGYNFERASAGLVGDPRNGVMTYEKIEFLEPSPEVAAFPKAGAAPAGAPAKKK